MNIVFLLRCCVIVDNFRDFVMPEHSVLCSPDDMYWAHVILTACTQTISR